MRSLPQNPASIFLCDSPKIVKMSRALLVGFTLKGAAGGAYRNRASFLGGPRPALGQPGGGGASGDEGGASGDGN